MPGTLESNLPEKVKNKPSLSDNPKSEAAIMLEKFKASVEHHAKTMSPEVFKNGDLQHSQIVLEALFKYAKNHIVIYDNELNGEIAEFPSCKEEIVNFLQNRKGELEIIVDNISENKSTLELLKTYKSNGWKVNLLIPESSKKTELNQKRSELHKNFTYYASADRKMIRVEKSASKKAYCSFNQPDLANKLLSYFIEEKNYCRTIL